MTPRNVPALLAAAAWLSGWTVAASASPFVINNTPGSSQQTLVEAASTNPGANGAPTSFFSSGNSSDSPFWGPNIGGPNTGGTLYQTIGLTASYTPGNGTTTFGTVTLAYNTSFANTNPNGVDPLAGTDKSVYAADIFLKSDASSSALTSAFNWGISLGKTQATDGGLAVGLYESASGNSISNNTSEQVWSNSLNGYVFGGGFAASSAFTSGTCKGNEVVPGQQTGGEGTCGTGTAPNDYSEASPTVLTGGTLDKNVAVGENWSTTDAGTACANDPATLKDNVQGCMTVTLAATNTQGMSDLSGLFSNFDIFWGTGDCSNAPIWGNIADLIPAPEPSSLALLASAALGLGIMRRRKRKTAATG